MLYNHIWHSQLPLAFIREIYEQKRYRQIIGHKNFNPRLISYITDFQRLQEHKPKTYWAYALALLNNPAAIWLHPFENQMDETARWIVLLVTLHGGRAREALLTDAFAKLNADTRFAACTGSREFAFLARQISGSLVNRSLDAKTYEVSYSHFNPSVSDFVLHRYANDVVALTLAIDCQRQKRCVVTGRDAARDGIVDSSSMCKVAEKLLLRAVESEFADCPRDYVATVAHLVLRAYVGVSISMTAPIKAAVHKATTHTLAIPSDNDVVAACELCTWLISEKLECASLGATLLSFFKEQSNFDDDEVVAMQALAFKMSGYREVGFDARDVIREIAIASIQSSIEDDIGGSHLLFSVDEGDYQGATKAISGYIDDRFSKVGLSFDRNARQEILDVLCVETLLDDHFGHFGGDPDGAVVHDSAPLSDEIDELFRRDDL